MGKRVSLEQRRKLFSFMQGHEDLARGRVSGPDAARNKKILLDKLAAELNAIGSGATKSPEKWFKSWQDWKSDVKAKSLKISKARAGTGGGPCPVPLSPLEEDLLQFFGVEMVEGLSGVADPLEVSEAAPASAEIQNIVVQEEPPPPPPPPPLEHRRPTDPLHATLERQAAALEDVAAGMHSIAAALQKIAAALQPENRMPRE